MVVFAGYECYPYYGIYFNGNISIRLLDKNDGCPVATATMSPDFKLEEAQVAIKNYGENIGMVDALKEANIITNFVKKIDCGFESLDVYTLSDEALKNMK